MTACAVDGFGDVFEDEIEVDFVFLLGVKMVSKDVTEKDDTSLGPPCHRLSRRRRGGRLHLGARRVS